MNTKEAVETGLDIWNHIVPQKMPVSRIALRSIIDGQILGLAGVTARDMAMGNIGSAFILLPLAIFCRWQLGRLAKSMNNDTKNKQ